jgi:SAM-dependent methyltransferase
MSDTSYTAYYKQNRPKKVYPTEFVIRSFLGKYPRLNSDPSGYNGKRILDLGFGDGRNMPLLSDLGFEIHGVEVTESICEQIKNQMLEVGISIESKKGRNSAIPYPDNYFDFILACNSCYYVDEGNNYGDNLREIHRVLKPGGKFIHSLPMGTTFIMNEAIDTGNGHMRITQDPYGVRVGAILKKYDISSEIERDLSPLFANISIGSCKDDFWGSHVHLWYVVCEKKPIKF